jgi:hypothetical protein
MDDGKVHADFGMDFFYGSGGSWQDGRTRLSAWHDK